MMNPTASKTYLHRVITLVITLCCSLLTAVAQVDSFDDGFNQMDESGNISRRSENFNKHNKDTTDHNKAIPKGVKVWTVDRKFGNVIPAVPDTLPHLYMNTTFNTGFHGAEPYLHRPQGEQLVHPPRSL